MNTQTYTHEASHDAFGNAKSAWRGEDGNLYYRSNGNYFRADAVNRNQALWNWEMNCSNGAAKIGDTVSVWGGKNSVQITLDAVYVTDSEGRYKFEIDGSTFRVFPNQITKV